MSSKITQARFPSVCNNLQRRQSKQGFGMSSTKQEITGFESDGRILQPHSMSNTQSQVAKKIQSKLRMRKPSGSEKKLKETLPGKDLDLMMQTKTDYMADLRDQIQNIWENSQEVYDTLTACGIDSSTVTFKEQILKQSGLILCQVSKGQNLENVIVERLTKKLSKLKCIRKCEEKQKFVNSMFDNRLQKLSQALKTR